MGITRADRGRIQAAGSRTGRVRRAWTSVEAAWSVSDERAEPVLSVGSARSSRGCVLTASAREAASGGLRKLRPACARHGRWKRVQGVYFSVGIMPESSQHHRAMYQLWRLVRRHAQCTLPQAQRASHVSRARGSCGQPREGKHNPQKQNCASQRSGGLEKLEITQMPSL